MSDWSDRFVELEKSAHDRQVFDCGKPPLNEFLQTRAHKHQTSGISKTMVLPAIRADENGKHLVCAFYTLSSSVIEREALPEGKKLPRYPVPVFVLAQLAIHTDYQGCGLGKNTLISALRHCSRIYRELPAYAVVVDCLDEEAERFYQQFGFVFLGMVNGRKRLYLPMRTVLQLFSES